MKSTKKSAKKLPAGQEFTIVSVTRAEIAEALNNANEDFMGEPKFDIKKFTANDPRLTDERCKEIAESLADGAFSSDEEYEWECETYNGILESLVEAKLV